MLVEARDLALENAKLLKSLRRSHRAGTILRVIYWVAILGVSFGAYYLIQPYVDMLKGSFGNIGGIGSVSPKAMTFEGALENIKAIKDIYSQ